MIVFPNAKINIGLNVVSRRPDGYHNLETIFYPVNISDALEMIEASKTSLTFSGIEINGPAGENLVLKAYQILKADFSLPPVHFHLHKNIPFGAGLGGGSSDAAFALKMLNEYFCLNLSVPRLEKYASKIGADCAFFIQNSATFATGIGNVFQKINLDLSKYKLVVLKPPVEVATADAYRNVLPATPLTRLTDSIKQPLETWKETVKNDFEPSVFARFPEIKALRDSLYNMGAIFASMSGSGSSVFGIFSDLPANFDKSIPKGIFIYR